MKMLIRPQTVKLISQRIADTQTGEDIVRILVENGISRDNINYPNTKWRMLFEVFSQLSNSHNGFDNQLLINLIETFIHPITLDGNKDYSHSLAKTFNEWLQYDGLSLVINKPEGPKIEKLYSSQEVDNQIKENKSDYRIVARVVGDIHKEELVIVKKSYRLLIEIVDTFLDKPSNPSEELNEAYVKLLKVFRQAISTLIKVPDTADYASVDTSILFLNYPHIPFENLYGAESRYGGVIDEEKRKSIKSKMNEYFGYIMDCAIECDIGNLGGSNFQDLFCNISKLLEKEQRENTQIESTKTFTRNELILDMNMATLKYKFKIPIKVALNSKPILLLRKLLEEPRYFEYRELAKFLEVGGPIDESTKNSDISREVNEIKKELVGILKSAGLETDDIKKMISTQNGYGYGILKS